MSTSTRIIKNTGFLYVKMMITVFISLYTTRLVLNSLGTSDFGIFGIVGGAIAMLGFLNGAMSGATQRFMNYSQGQGDVEKQKSIFNNSVVLHWGIAVAVLILLESAYFVFFNGVLNIEPSRVDAAKWVYHFAVASTLFTIITVPYDAAINAHENMFFYSVLGVLENFAKLAIALWIVYTSGDKLIWYGFLMALLTIIMLIIRQLYCRFNYQECRLQLFKYINKNQIKDLSSFAGWNFINSMGTLLGNCGGNVIVNHFFGTAINAAQNVGSQLRGQMLAFSNNMLKALNPVIAKKEGAGDRKAMLKFSMTGSKLSFILFAFMALPFIVETEYILKLWLKNVPDWTVCFSRYQMIIALAEQLTITLNTSLSATGKIKTYSVFCSVARFAPLFIYFTMYTFGATPDWQYVVILINFGVVINGFLLYQCQKYCDLDVKYYCISVLLPCIFCSIVAVSIGFCIRLMLQEGMNRLILSLVGTLLSYFICLFIWGFNNEEKSLIRQVLCTVKHKVFK